MWKRLIQSICLLLVTATVATANYGYCTMCGYSHRNVPPQYLARSTGSTAISPSSQPATSTGYTKICVNGRCYLVPSGAAAVQHTQTTLSTEQTLIAAPDPQAATPEEAIDDVLAAMELSASDVVYDLGCGDGRVLIRAAQRYRCRCVGIERDARLVAVARERVRAAGLSSSRVRIVHGNVTDYELTGATVVYMFQSYDTIRQFVRTIPETVRIVSFQHAIYGRPQRLVERDRWRFYVSR